MSKVFNNFTGMKEGGTYYLRNFEPAKEGTKSVLRQGRELERYTYPSPAALVWGMADDIGSGYNKYYITEPDASNNMKVYQGYDLEYTHTPSNVTGSDHPDITESVAGDVIYTTGNHLGRQLSGTDNSGTDNKTTSMTDTTKNFGTEGVEVGATIINSTDGSSAEITSISTTTNTNDTLNFSGGLSGGTDNDFDDGDSYQVFADNFKSYTMNANYIRQIIQFEDRNLIGEGNYLASLDSSNNWNSAYKPLPLDYYIASMSWNDDLAVAANHDTKDTGVLLFWNGWSDGWNKRITLNNEINCVTAYQNGWIFNEGPSIYFTNGNTKTFLAKLPNIHPRDTVSIGYNGMKVVGEELFILLGESQGNLHGGTRAGLWTLNIPKKELTYSSLTQPTPAPSDNYYYVGNIFYIGNTLYLSYRGNNGTTDYSIDILKDYVTPSQSIITLPVVTKKEGNIKKIEVLWSRSNIADIYESVDFDGSVDITLAISDCTRHIWKQEQVGSDATSNNTLKDIQNAALPHSVEKQEIEVLTGNNTGERAFITDMSCSGGYCTLTLDTNLSNQTTASNQINILPFKKVATKTFSKVEKATFYPRGIFDKYQIEIRVNQSGFPIQIDEVRVYDE